MTNGMDNWPKLREALKGYLHQAGFTGTRRGLTNKQRTELRDILRSLKRDFEFHHGDCIGADEEAHCMAKELGGLTFIHPPKNPSQRAFCKGFFSYEPQEYLRRNHSIVDSTDFLIVCPKTNSEELRSGTWATYRYAVSRGKPIIVLSPY